MTRDVPPQNQNERPADLQALREALERIDHRLLRLLRERMDLVEGVAEAKLGSA